MKYLMTIAFSTISMLTIAQPITLPEMETRWMTFLDGMDRNVNGVSGMVVDKKGNLLVNMNLKNLGNSNYISTGALQSSPTGNFPRCLFKLDTLGKLKWGTYFGSSGILGKNIVLDAGENIILVGNICQYCDPPGAAIITPGANVTSIGTATFIRPNGAVRNTNLSDGVVSRFSEYGELLWSTFQGGLGTDQIQAIATDSNNNIYVSGNTNSLEGIGTPGSFRSEYAPGINAYAQSEWYWRMNTGAKYLVKYDSSGQKLWGTYFGDVQPDSLGGRSRVYDSKIDSDGNILVCGLMSKTAQGFTTPGLDYSYLADTCTQGVFINKFSPSGQRLWGLFYPLHPFSNNNANFNCNIVARGTDVFLVGNTVTKGLGTPGAYHQLHQGGSDVFMAKFNKDGRREWHTYIGGPGNEVVAFSSMTIAEEKGSIYVGGTTTSEAGFADSGSHFNPQRPIFNTFVAKFGLGGTKQWITYTSPETAYTQASSLLDYEGSIATNNSGKFYHIRSNRAFDAQPSTYAETVQPNPTTVGFITTYLSMLVDTSARFNDPADSSVNFLPDPPTIDTLDNDTAIIILYPNPSNGNFTIKGQSLQKYAHSYGLYNAAGQLIDAKMLLQAPIHHIYYGNRLAAGVYFLRLENKATGKQVSFKMVVGGGG